ncbi:hypothetical protein ACOMHN_007177 [Nucella lapillus]
MSESKRSDKRLTSSPLQDENEKRFCLTSEESVVETVPGLFDVGRFADSRFGAGRFGDRTFSRGTFCRRTFRRGTFSRRTFRRRTFRRGTFSRRQVCDAPLQNS